MTINNPNNSNANLVASGGVVSATGTLFKEAMVGRAKITSIEPFDYYENPNDVDPQKLLKINYSLDNLPYSEDGLFLAGATIKIVGSKETAGFEKISEGNFTYIEYPDSKLSGDHVVKFTSGDSIVITNPLELINANQIYSIIGAAPAIPVTQYHIPGDLGYIMIPKCNLIATTSLRYQRKGIVEITLGDLEIPWEADSTYTFEIEPGFLLDTFDPNLPNQSQALTINSNPPPVISSPTYTNKLISLYYNRDIIKSSGSYYLYDSLGNLVITFEPADVEIFNNRIARLNTTRLLEAETTYYVTSDANTVKDFDFIGTNAITDTNAYRYTTTAAPTVISVNTYWHKINQYIKVQYSSNPIELTTTLSKTIKLYKIVAGQPDELLTTYLPDDSRLNVLADMLTIRTPGFIVENSSYRIDIEDGFVKDSDSFSATAYSVSYQTEETNFPGLKSNITSTGFLSTVGGRVKKFNATLTSQVVLNTSGRVNGFGDIVMDATASASATGIYIPYLINIDNRNYTANYGNNIFSTSSMHDHDEAKSYQVSFSSPNGKFGTSTGSVVGYNITGTLLQINTQLPNVYFWPTKGYTSNTTYTVTLRRDGVVYQTLTKTLTRTATYTGQLYTYTASGTWAPTAVDIEYAAVMDYLVVGGGGAGAVSMATANQVGGAGGGSSGEAKYISSAIVQNQSYNVIVGTGGSWSTLDRTNRLNKMFTLPTPTDYLAPAGTSSSFNGTSSSGGGGGQGMASDGQVEGDWFFTEQPDGGSNTTYTGGTGLGWVSRTNSGSGDTIFQQGPGGGGAGANSNGVGAFLSEPFTGSRSAGVGGNGLLSNISGSFITYAVGGAGGDTVVPATLPTKYTTYGCGGRASYYPYGMSGGVVTDHDAFYGQNGVQGVVFIKVRIV